MPPFRKVLASAPALGPPPSSSLPSTPADALTQPLASSSSASASTYAASSSSSSQYLSAHSPRPPQSPTSPTSPHSSGSRTSMDSGYASMSPFLTPHPDWALSRTYENWKIADAASQRLFVDVRQLEDLRARLRAAKKREAAARSPQPKRKPSALGLRIFRGKAASPPSAAAPLPEEGAEELPSVADLEAQLAQLLERMEPAKAAAGRLDGYFEELKKVLDDGRPVSWRSTTSGATGHPYLDDHARARKTVAARDQAYIDGKETAAALQHAQNAVQSAHHHYTKALDLIDAVCSPKKSRWEAMVGDEQSRQETYREAADWASKAQRCFDECVASLTPYAFLLSREDEKNVEELRETGLLQALQFYKLMYGGPTLAMGIQQQQQIMTLKQEAVYQRLTTFAVWVQNCTRHCESVARDAHESRDRARRELVALWVRADDDCETFSLAARASAAGCSRRRDVVAIV
ncbi:uncharacterized protein BXZ73DRAFT_106413 [Epithele typhae]|uniref:uncharacterized protein n=1 Tax=Epithele typhae TaxID=378194 RepID=UPI00200803F3|nr:uncharacterized protein BXZ73DRAFT_106413 [Epithele typhae]KAH9914904.1 hypothetical protein BXZ73DRAFT_106413 [Epithele typhae]